MLPILIVAWIISNRCLIKSDAGSEDKYVPVGKLAGKYQFPFFVQLQIPISNQDKTFPIMCGASLIEPEWILTAAHCFPQSTHEQIQLVKNKTLLTYMGSIKLFDQKAEIRTITEVHIHPDYYYNEEPLALLNDIAIAKVEQPYELSRVIQTITLAAKGSQNRCRRGKIVGFGRISMKGVSGKYVSYIEVVSREKYEITDKLRKSSTIFVSKTIRREHSYLGDSGSPFLCYYNNKAVQYGVFSYYRTTTESLVTAYESVDKFTDFILTFINKRQKIINVSKDSYHRSGDNKLKQTTDVFLIVFVFKCLSF